MLKATRMLGLLLGLSVRCFAWQEWMDLLAQKQLDAREQKIASIHTLADARARQQYVREKILSELGGLPDYSGPLNARVAGLLRAPGFVIEKVIFESLPGVYVTANLYRPDRAGKFPGVLLPLGHWEYGKPAVQQIAGNLALKGFVVLTFDPYGQGERQQLYDRRLHGSLAVQATEQHLLAGGLSLLIGQSFARYRIWDAKRALDYLVSRPEVLTDKIGCTGCSGGGTITTYISALDSRIKVAAPACYITSWRLLFAGAVGDSEQSLPGFLAAGLDQADYIELFAPKPWLISSTRDDFFPLAGARMAYEEAQRWYGLYGMGDRVKWEVGPGGHGTPLNVREAIYEWMIRWLRDGQGQAAEQEVALLPEHELWATEKGQVAEMPGSRDVFDVIREEWRRLSKPRPRAEMLAILRELVQPPAAAPKFQTEGGRFTLEAEEGVRIEAELLKPASGGGGAGTVVVDAYGRARDRAQALVAQGQTVLLIRPRAIPARGTSRAYSGDWIPNVRALLIGRNLPAMRAHDILCGYQLLVNLTGLEPERVRAEATGIAGVWLMMAAAVEPRLRIQVDRTPASFASAFESSLTRDLHSAVIPGFALSWDLNDLVEPDRLERVDPTDWLGHVVPWPSARYTPAAQ